MTYYQDWDNEQCLQLIKEYEKQPVIWNAKHHYHNQANQRFKAWDIIAKKMNLEIESIKFKMNSILASYRREKAKERKAANTGKQYKSGWYAYDSLQFLLRNNEKLSEEDEDEEHPENIYVLGEHQNSPENTLFDDETLENLLVPIKQIKRNKTSGKEPRNKKIKPIETQYENNPSPKQDDEVEYSNVKEECTAYGQYIANKLIKYKRKTRAYVEHLINNIIFEADLGKFDNKFDIVMPSTSSFTFSDNSANGAESGHKYQIEHVDINEYHE